MEAQMNTRWRRGTLGILIAAASLSVPIAFAWPTLAGTGPRTLAASSPATLGAAISQARPGDRIQVADGTYTAPVKVTRSGTAAAPITIAAAHLGQATIT